MTSNPLLQKYDELYGKKEEPPEIVEEPKKITTKPPSFITYDTDSGNDSFLQIAEKIKNGEAKVSSVTFNRDSVGVFTTGLTTITFEVQVWDT